MQRLALRVILTGAALAFPSACTTRAQAAEFEVLPLYPGGVDAMATGVSRDGSTVVGHASTGPAGLPRQAVTWRDGRIVALPDLPGGPDDSIATAASGDGSIVVGSGNGSGYDGQAVRWVNGVVGVLPGTAGPPSDPYSHAAAISRDGSVVVGRSGRDAFRWFNGVVTPVFAGTNDVLAVATGVSAGGSVVVGTSWSSQASGLSTAFRWDNGVVTPLHGSNDYAGTYAGAVSADGRVVAGVVYEGHPTAARWVNGVMERLTEIDQASEALAVSGDGSVVVGDAGYGPYPTAMIWDADHGMRYLQDVLRDDYGLKLGDLSLIEATGVSDDGKTIVGYGFHLDGRYYQAFRATLPEPAGMFVLILSAATLTLRRRPR